MAPKLTIRAARSQDARAIAEVHVASWLRAYTDLVPKEKLAQLDVAQSERVWNERLAGPETQLRAWVAVADEAVVAYAYTQPSMDEDLGPGVHELTALYLVPSAWRTGIGTVLLAAAENALREAGVLEATLWVIEGNLRAIGFYEARGWGFDIRDPSFKDFGVPALRYRKAL